MSLHSDGCINEVVCSIQLLDLIPGARRISNKGFSFHCRDQPFFSCYVSLTCHDLIYRGVAINVVLD